MPVLLAATTGLTIIASMFFASSQIFSTQFLALRERIEESFKIQVPVAAVLNSNPSVLFNESETIAQGESDQMQQLAVVQTLIAPVENFPPQTQPLYGAQIYTPENTYTTINSKDIEQRLLIQKNYFSKQIDRIYDRVKNNTQELNDRVDSVTTTSSGISFATIALGGTGISTVPSYGQLLMGDGSGGYTLIATSSLGISGGGGSSQWTTSGSDIYYTTGNVGIGTTTVNRKLVVDNNTTSGTVATFQSYAAGSDTAIRINNNSISSGSLTETTVLNFSFNDLVGASITGGKTEDFMSSANRSGYLAFNTRKDNVMSEALRINTGGNIGVGTTSPFAKFSINTLTSDAGGQPSFVIASSTASATSTHFIVTSEGRVGIGTTSPQRSLHVVGSGIISERASADPHLILRNSGYSTTGQDWNFRVATGDGSFVIRDGTGPTQDIFTMTVDANIGISTSTPYAKLSVAGGGVGTTTMALRPVLGQTANILDLYDASGSLVNVIAANGNIGIASSTPSAALSIGTTFTFASSTGRMVVGDPNTLSTAPRISVATTSGSLKILASPGAFGGAGFEIYGQDAPGTIGSITGNAVGAGASIIRTKGAGSVWFWHAPNRDIDNGASISAMISTNGVGIGTTSPYAKLSVQSVSTGTTTLALRPMSGQISNILDIYNTSGFLSTVITSSGNWGIGTTSPYAKLSVEGQLVSSFITTSNSTATSTIAGPLGVRRLLYPNGEILTDTTNFVIGSTASSTLFYPNNMPLATADGTLYYGDSNVLATKGAGIVSAKIYYPNNNVLVDAQALYYPSGTSVLTDITGQIYYHNSTVMSDANSRLYYGSGAELADELGNLNYGNGLLLADANGDIYDGHATDSYLFDVGNLYLRNRLISNSGAGGISIDDLGNVGIGEASPTYPLHVTAASLTDVARFAGKGRTQCTVVTGTGFSCTSDERFKTNIATINSSALQNVLKLRPVNFNWKYDPEGQTQVGFIAQELEEIFPELVRNDSSGYKSVAYAQLTPLLVKAIQEQNVSVEKLSLILDSEDPLPKIFVDRIVAAISQVSNLVVKTITADSVRTKELCVEDVCVTREQFLKMIRDSGARESASQQDDQEEQDSQEENSEDSTEQEDQQDEPEESQEQDEGEQDDGNEEGTQENSDESFDESTEDSEDQTINDRDQVTTDTPETTEAAPDDPTDSQTQDSDSGGVAEGDSAGDSNATE